MTNLRITRPPTLPSPPHIDRPAVIARAMRKDLRSFLVPLPKRNQPKKKRRETTKEHCFYDCLLSRAEWRNSLTKNKQQAERTCLLYVWFCFFSPEHFFRTEMYLSMMHSTLSEYTYSERSQRIKKIVRSGEILAEVTKVKRGLELRAPRRN